MVRRIPFAGGGIEWDTIYYSLHGYSSSVYSHDETRKIKISVKYEDNSENFESVFEYQNKSFTQNDFMKNGTRISELSSTEHKRLASTIWYVAPSRVIIPYQTRVGQETDDMQPLHPAGSNVTDFLVQRVTSKDPNWDYAEEWLSKIDEKMTTLKTPISGNVVSTVTTRNDGNSKNDININLQGSGIQNAATIIAAVVFSPPRSTIIIEEPETYLHSTAIQVLINLFNDVINKFSKQIIISTHSWEIISRYTLDLQGTPPTGISNFVQTNSSNFKFLTISNELSTNRINERDLTQTTLGKLYEELSKSNMF